VTALVFPVGHYLGPLHDEASARPAYHLVRVGREVLSLTGGAETAVWMAAHGSFTGDGVAPVTRETVLSSVPAWLSTGAGDAFAALLEAGLLIGAEAVGGCRLGPLMIGLGARAEGDGFAIGVGGLELVVDEPLFRVWECAPDYPTVAAACEAARADLAETVGGLHRLLCVNAAYLDAATSR
jgi:sugar/nucleoside kinase (ribokinase family)